MTISIAEPDWKIFKRLREVALERLCERTLADARQVADDSSQSALVRYHKLFELVRLRDKDVARGFDDFRRSTAVIQIRIIRSMGLLTDEETTEFSEETQVYLGDL